MAWLLLARSRTVAISPERRIGLVAPTLPPALRTPSQQAHSIALLGPRRKTRLPVTSPSSPTSRRAMRSERWRISHEVQVPTWADDRVGTGGVMAEGFSVWPDQLTH